MSLSQSKGGKARAGSPATLIRPAAAPYPVPIGFSAFSARAIMWPVSRLLIGGRLENSGEQQNSHIQETACQKGRPMRGQPCRWELKGEGRKSSLDGFWVFRTEIPIPHPPWGPGKTGRRAGDDRWKTCQEQLKNSGRETNFP